MRFGIFLFGRGGPGQSRELFLADQLEKARLAKSLGFHSLWVGQGYLNNGWNPTVVLARVAAEAPGMELGMVSLLPLQHPVELADQISSLDAICGGRFTLAAGLGWRDYQLRAFGVPKEQRLARFREILRAMKRLWTEERITHRGRHFQIEDVPGAPQPVQRPYPRILFAPNLDPGVVRAARMADGWLVSVDATLTTIRRQVGLYRDALKESGRRDYVAALREMYVAEDRAKAIAAIQPYLEPHYSARASLGHDTELPEADRIDVPFEQLLEERFIIGSPDECAAEVERYREIGVKEIIVRCHWPGIPAEDALKAIRLFGREVMPRFL